jgi:hypothetical protein
MTRWVIALLIPLAGYELDGLGPRDVKGRDGPGEAYVVSR